MDEISTPLRPQKCLDWRVALQGLVEEGKITLKEAREKIGVSYRQAKRIRRALRVKGVKGMIHGNTGRIPWNVTADSVRQRVLELSKQLYGDFNDMHLTEKLSEEHRIELSRETVRKLSRRAGIGPKRRRRVPGHRKRRERKAQEGAMVLWDGSPHPWLGSEQPACCLMAAMDDATGKLLAARFFPFEGSSGYLWLLREVVKRYGVPLAMYHDRHGSLHRNDSHGSLEAANGFLKTFIPRFNRRFALPARDSEKAWRKAPKELDLDRWISFRYRSFVGNDNCVRIGGLILDLPPGPHRRSYAEAQVEVRPLLNGAWRVYDHDQLIDTHPSTELREPV